MGTAVSRNDTLRYNNDTLRYDIVLPAGTKARARWGCRMQWFR
jgi:hypothetical protein